MKFSNNYLLYPTSQALLEAVSHYRVLSGSIAEEDLLADKRLDERDNFIHARGNFEAHHYSSNTYESARVALEAELNSTSQEESILDWASLQNSLGNILAALGQMQSDQALYDQAIVLFTTVLDVINQEDAPLVWASAQYNLGSATQALGKLLSDSKRLKLSVDAYTNALLVWTREDNPQEWASTMHQLGTTFHAHGLLLSGNRTFQKSVIAYKNALAEFDADESALALASTHNNRGAVLHHLGESEQNAGRLEEAIRSYEAALSVCMEQQLPFHLAVLCRVNKSTVRNVLADLTQDAVVAEEVADDFEIIIECFENALQPLCLKHCEAQLIKAQALVSALT